MKHILTLIAFSLFISTTALAQDCTNPVSNSVYQSNFNIVAVQQTNQKKLDKATEFVNSNCVTSAQVKNLALLFTEDSYRLEFCKAAYLHTFDRANFYDVYDAFNAFSFAFRLNDFIHEQNTQVVVTTPESTPVSNPNPVFPNYIYPNITTYNGKKGCPGPVISEDAFKLIAQNVFKQPTDESRIVAIQSASDQNCLSFAMIMKLTSLVNSESFRLNILKSTFAKVFDQDNYASGTVLLEEANDQAAWISYAKTALTPLPPPCITSDADFKTVLSNVQSKSFDDDKMNVISLASKDRCFSVAQIRTLSKEFAFGDAKIKVFKMLYAKCTDQSNYYQLLDELTFPSDKDNLSNFIKNGGH